MYKQAINTLAGLLVVVLAVGGCGNTSSSVPAQALPALEGAEALSNHYVEVKFAAAPGQRATEPDIYTITAADGTVLPVEAARISDDPTAVILTTGPQEEVEYELALRGSRQTTQAKESEPGGPIITFLGSITSEPYVASAISLSPTTLLVTFSGQMDNNVEVVEFYRISAPDLQISAAEQGNQKPRSC